MPRNYTVRKMKNMKELVEGMQYPYNYITAEDDPYHHYTVKEILRPIVVEREEADPGDFPYNIQDHYWIRLGENDGDSWISAGKLTNGNYFLYTGSCDYTGFDCQGCMYLWVSSSWKTIVDHAMDEETYRLFKEEMK